MSKTINLSLDTAKSDIQNPKILLRQGDGNYQTLRVTITSNGEPTDLTNADVIYLGTTSADHKIIDSNITKVDALNGVIDYQPPKQWGQDMGNFKNSYFEITTGDSTGSTASFKVSVLEAVDLNAEQAGDYITVVDGIVAVVRKELSDQLDDVKTKTDNATGLVKQASDNLVAMAKNYNTDITNKYNDANAKASNINQLLNSGAFAKVGASNTFSENQTMSKDLTVGGALHANADWSHNSEHAINADYAANSGHAELANNLGDNADIKIQTIHTKTWSWFDGGIEIHNGIKSHDWANFNYFSANGNMDLGGNIRAKAQVRTINIGSLTGTAIRFGNVVFMSISPQNWPYGTGSPWTIAYDMNIPLGYRPASNSFVMAMNKWSVAPIIVHPNGSMFFTSAGVDNSTQFEAYGTWITNDDFPA